MVRDPHIERGNKVMGSTDLNLSILSWGIFWTGVVFILVTGGFFSFGILRLVQQKKSQAIISLLISGVSLVAFVSFAIRQ